MNPDEPAQAVLIRDAPAWMTGSYLSFGLSGLAATAGLAMLMLLMFRVTITARRLARSHPDEPWCWKPEWSSLEVPAKNAHSVGQLALVGVLFVLASLPSLMWTWPVLLKEGGPWDCWLLFSMMALLGPGLLVAALFIWRLRSRFRGSRLVLDHIPLEPGQPFSAELLLTPSGPGAGNLRALIRLQRVMVKGKSAATKTMLSHAMDLEPAPALITVGETRIPLQFTVPPGLPEFNDTDPGEKFLWELLVTGQSGVGGFKLVFLLPIFYTTDPALMELDDEGA